MNFTPQTPTRLCRRCLFHYHYIAFGLTKTGRVKSLCIPCENRRKQEQKFEKQNYDIYHKARPKKLEIEKNIYSDTPIISLTINFDD